MRERFKYRVSGHQIAIKIPGFVPTYERVITRIDVIETDLERLHIQMSLKCSHDSGTDGGLACGRPVSSEEYAGNIDLWHSDRVGMLRYEIFGWRRYIFNV